MPPYGVGDGGVEQSVHFKLTLKLKARAGAGKIGVANTGMKHDFGVALGKCVNQETQAVGGNTAGRSQAEKMIGRAETILAEQRMKLGRDGAYKRSGEKLAGAARAGRPGATEPLDRLANTENAELLSDAAESVENTRMRMRMLVRVEMRGRNASALNLFDLGAQFPLDVRATNGA